MPDGADFVPRVEAGGCESVSATEGGAGQRGSHSDRAGGVGNEDAAVGSRGGRLGAGCPGEEGGGMGLGGGTRLLVSLIR